MAQTAQQRPRSQKPILCYTNNSENRVHLLKVWQNTFASVERDIANAHPVIIMIGVPDFIESEIEELVWEENNDRVNT